MNIYSLFLEKWDVFTLNRKSASSIILELSKHALGTIELRYCLQMNLIFNHDKKAERAI